MRLSPLLLTTQYYINNVRPKNGRRPSRHPFPYNNILPMALRDQVSGKSNKQQATACLQEMTLMLACFKNADFDQSLCAKEIELFKKCNEEYMASKRLKKEQDRGTELIPNAKKLSFKHINVLLKKYPQPK
ncbi:hypothetical protein SK128_025260 [Halocaridina rubra]|uniref:Coiled-coil-helix-coiled-coil-helix domain-containing protein 1 n=1 Tax=Halocaridina rubra TaxID=373956 RepID=A0AAN8WAK2_HALRR